MEIPNAFQISDIRDNSYFKKQTFCGYKKNHIFQAFEKSIMGGKLEESCNWSIEIVISGYIDELWEYLILFICKRINIANIEMITHIYRRLQNYKNLVK